MADTQRSSDNAFGDGPIPVHPCKCGYQWREGALPEEVCHHASGGGEYIVICPRCRADGELKATPAWAVEAWNRAHRSMTNIAKPTPEMIEAGVKAWYDTDHEGSTVGQSVCDIYTAMVASAPQEPVADDDADALLSRIDEEIEQQRMNGGDMLTYGEPDPLLIDLRAFVANRLQAKADWQPHLDYAGEPMKPGEFRDRPEAPETGEG